MSSILANINNESSSSIEIKKKKQRTMLEETRIIKEITKTTNLRGAEAEGEASREMTLKPALNVIFIF